MLAAGADRVYLSADGGQSWQAPQLNRNDHISAQTAVLSRDGQQLAATGNGAVFVSGDGGARWSAEQAACLSFFSVEGLSLAMSDDGRRLAATTHQFLCERAAARRRGAARRSVPIRTQPAPRTCTVQLCASRC